MDRIIRLEEKLKEEDDPDKQKEIAHEIVRLSRR
jgi:hypothetical protein